MRTRISKAIARTVETLLCRGWIFLALPACGFSGNAGPVPPNPNLPPGPLPRSTALFCDIEKVPGRHCATDLDLTIGIRLAEAAIALVEGRDSTVGLDDSPEALARCGGRPEAIKFEGRFPEGLPVCLNCGTLQTFANNDAACKAACYDLFGTLSESGDFFPTNPPNPFAVAYCDDKARISTNYPRTNDPGCSSLLCGSDGVLMENVQLFDPRRRQKTVNWTDLRCAQTAIGELKRRLDPECPATGVHDAGAASLEVITKGDAYVEFSVSRNDQAVVVGLNEIPAACAPPSWCPDTDPTTADMPFQFQMGADGLIYVAVRGAIISSFGSYLSGQRYRITLRDRGDGTATVVFSRIVGASCPTALPCPQEILYTHTTTPAVYPMRVDSSFLGTDTVVTGAAVVRIQ